MAHVLRIANDSGSVIQYLSRNATTDPHLMQYTPAAPDLSTVDFTPEAMLSGGERFVTTRRNVTESAVIRLESASVTAMQTIVQNIEAILKRAEEWQRYGVGEPYYVQFTPHDYTGAQMNWRSEILSGRVELGTDAIDRFWGQKKIEVLVTWTRRYYWEASTLTSVSIRNPGDTITPVAIVNNPAGYNYVDTDDPITGSIPTPALLAIDKSTAVTSRPGSFYIGVNAWAPSGDPDDFVHLIQGEGSSVSGGSTVTPAATSSGNAYRALTVPVDEAEMARWALDPTSQVTQGGGRYFRVIARFANAAVPIVPTIGLRLKLALGTSDVVWTGPEVLVRADRPLCDLGVLRLPPANLATYDGFPLGGHSLLLFGRSLTDTTKALGVDYLQLTPLDSYRVFEAAAFGLDQFRQLIDEPARNLLYQHTITTGAGRSNVFNASGSPVWLWPGKTHRLIFLWALIDGTAPITDTVNISLSYRPRRLTI